MTSIATGDNTFTPGFTSKPKMNLRDRIRQKFAKLKGKKIKTDMVMATCYSADWNGPYTGSHGGRYYVNSETGRRSYGEHSGGDDSEPTPEPGKPKSAMKPTTTAFLGKLKTYLDKHPERAERLLEDGRVSRDRTPEAINAQAEIFADALANSDSGAADRVAKHAVDEWMTYKTLWKLPHDTMPGDVGKLAGTLALIRVKAAKLARESMGKPQTYARAIVERYAFQFTGPRTGQTRTVPTKSDIPKSVMQSGAYQEVHANETEKKVKESTDYKHIKRKGQRVDSHEAVQKIHDRLQSMKWETLRHYAYGLDIKGKSRNQIAEKVRALLLLKATEKAGKKEKLEGGKADGKPDSDFAADALKQGMKVEAEHTDDPAKAREIAKDHLAEDPKYYDKLAKMEAGKPRPSVDPSAGSSRMIGLRKEAEKAAQEKPKPAQPKAPREKMLTLAQKAKAARKAKEAAAKQQSTVDPNKPKFEYVRAPAGGKVSDVDGKHYAGGQLMPIHGLSVKMPKGQGVGVPSTPAVANENAKQRSAPEPRKPMTPEDIAAESERRAAAAKAREIMDGPLGQLARVNPRTGTASGVTGIGWQSWRKYAESVGEKRLQEIVKALPPPSDPEDRKWYDDGLNHSQDFKANAPKKHLKDHPSSADARYAIGEAFQSAKTTEDAHRIHRLLTGQEQPQKAAPPPSKLPGLKAAVGAAQRPAVPSANVGTIKDALRGIADRKNAAAGIDKHFESADSNQVKKPLHEHTLAEFGRPHLNMNGRWSVRGPALGTFQKEHGLVKALPSKEAAERWLKKTHERVVKEGKKSATPAANAGETRTVPNPSAAQASHDRLREKIYQRTLSHVPSMTRPQFDDVWNRHRDSLTLGEGIMHLPAEVARKFKAENPGADVRDVPDEVTPQSMADHLKRVMTGKHPWGRDRKPVAAKPAPSAPMKTKPPAAAATPAAPPKPSASISREDLRSGYDDQTIFRDQEDGIVAIPRLFKYLKQKHPDLTIEQLHDHLKGLEKEGNANLMIINEERLAKDPELSIRTPGGLKHFVYWHDKAAKKPQQYARRARHETYATRLVRAFQCR